MVFINLFVMKLFWCDASTVWPPRAGLIDCKARNAKFRWKSTTEAWLKIFPHATERLCHLPRLAHKSFFCQHLTVRLKSCIFKLVDFLLSYQRHGSGKETAHRVHAPPSVGTWERIPLQQILDQKEKDWDCTWTLLKRTAGETNIQKFTKNQSLIFFIKL